MSQNKTERLECWKEICGEGTEWEERVSSQKTNVINKKLHLKNVGHVSQCKRHHPQECLNQ